MEGAEQSGSSTPPRTDKAPFAADNIGDTVVRLDKVHIHMYYIYMYVYLTVLKLLPVTIIHIHVHVHVYIATPCM